VNPENALEACRSKLVTTTVCSPEDKELPVWQLIEVEDTEDVGQFVLPMATLAPELNPVPVIVSAVFPLCGPEETESEVMTGAGT